MDRRTKLRALIRSRFRGNQAEFASAIKRSPAQVNQWLSGHRAIGDAGARIIELALSLPSGYFDSANAQPPEGQEDVSCRGKATVRTIPELPEISAVVGLMRAMCVSQRGEVLGYARRVMETSRTTPDKANNVIIDMQEFRRVRMLL